MIRWSQGSGLTGLTAALLLAVPLCGAGEAEVSGPFFEVDALADGVYLFRPTDPRSGRTNSLVVEREDGLLVVDGQPSVEYGRQLLERIGMVSSKPVRYLVYSHSHLEALGGAPAFPAETLIVGTKRCRDALEDESYDVGAEVRALADEPDSWTPPVLRLPVLVLSATARLADPRHPVDLAPISHAHSPGDMLVMLPESEIVYVGPLLFRRGNPYAADADVGAWLAVLNGLAKMEPRTLVPLRGPVADLQSVRLDRDSLAWLRGNVEAAFVELVPDGQVSQWVQDRPDFGKYFDPEASPSFLPLLVDRTLEEALEQRRKRGLR